MAGVRLKDRHGMTRTPEYRAWCDMRNRCSNPKLPGYKNYGGRGIAVCRRWRESFAAFYADMGPRPKGRVRYTLERIDNSKGYSPGNCKWATYKEQLNNKRFGGGAPSGEANPKAKLTLEQVAAIRASTLTGPELAEAYGVSTSTINRARRGETWKGLPHE